MDNSKPSKDLFVPVERGGMDSEKISRPSLSFWQDSFNRLRKNLGAMAGVVTLIVLMLMAAFGPYMNQFDPYEQDLSRSYTPPKIPVLENIGWLGVDGMESTIIEGDSVDAAKNVAKLKLGAANADFIEYNVIDEGGNGTKAKVEASVDVYAAKGIETNHWFGTDSLGRDLWTRTWHGTRISLYIALLAAAIDMIIGVIYGGVSAYYGGRVDNIMQRIIEVLVGIPNLVIVILMILILEPGILSITIALTITGWISMARIIRGQVLKLKNQEFVLASRTLGAPDSRILKKHLVPNVTGLIVINTMFTIPSAIFFEAFLSFIGLGLPTPIASLGTLIDDGFKSLQTNPHVLIFPAIIISMIMVAFNILADGLRDAFDPKMRE
ncbi:oligopeptide transport system permease protein [Thalassobacillus cyri]|uniref:Oligopeptide transport system permease protein n=1 Tax=Thalassobacillus cyri TaxID=571932 RepID=A0A1H3VK58_9BACI|nr:oligopeptide ABC transporter permease [Thalassobacillus cyri]SDZ75061.1 oligopeptide transport system permease protein [Thalassobacillus cyri]